MNARKRWHAHTALSNLKITMYSLESASRLNYRITCEERNGKPVFTASWYDFPNGDGKLGEFDLLPLAQNACERHDLQAALKDLDDSDAWIKELYGIAA